MPRAHLRPPAFPGTVSSSAASSASEGGTGAEVLHGFPAGLSSEEAAAMEWGGDRLTAESPHNKLLGVTFSKVQGTDS